jgi:hypothetical protein
MRMVWNTLSGKCPKIRDKKELKESVPFQPDSPIEDLISEKDEYRLRKLFLGVILSGFYAQSPCFFINSGAAAGKRSEFF